MRDKLPLNLIEDLLVEALLGIEAHLEAPVGIR